MAGLVVQLRLPLGCSTGWLLNMFSAPKMLIKTIKKKTQPTTPQANAQVCKTSNAKTRSILLKLFDF